MLSIPDFLDSDPSLPVLSSFNHVRVRVVVHALLDVTVPFPIVTEHFAVDTILPRLGFRSFVVIQVPKEHFRVSMLQSQIQLLPSFPMSKTLSYYIF
jgi:hypothetical protein